MGDKLRKFFLERGSGVGGPILWGRVPGAPFFAKRRVGDAPARLVNSHSRVSPTLSFGKNGAPAASVWTHNLASATEDSHAPLDFGIFQ